MDTDTAFAGAAALARRLAEGEVTAPGLVDGFLARIDRLDGTINAFRIVLADRAKADAAEAQRRLDAGERRPLLGVPVAVKDDVDVAGEVTAWGTAAHGPPATADAEVVRRLREAGAVIVGKTNTPEMTIWPFTESATFGDTRNPWDPERSPGGSSGGAAAAVAAGLVAAAVGSDGGGSIRTPAAWCGLFGLKPQRHRVPTAPHEDGWQGLLVYGPITRTVADAALLLDALAEGPAPEGGFTGAATRPPGHLRVAHLPDSPLPGLRVSPAAQEAVRRATDELAGQGHEVVAQDPTFPAWSAGRHITSRYLRGIHDDVATLPHPERLERRTRTVARWGGRISDRRIAKVRAGEAELSRRVGAIFEEIDLLVTPVTVAGSTRVGRYRGKGAVRTMVGAFRVSPFLAIANATGQPAAAVPMGLDEDGLPVGVQLLARPGEEATLLAVSAQLEASLPWADRRPPVN